MFKVNGKELSLSQAIVYIRVVQMRMSTKEFTKLTKISCKTLSDIENGRIEKPHAETLNKIAKACHVPIEDLLDYIV